MQEGERMSEIVLTPKGSIDIMVEAEVITPDAFAGKSVHEIEALKVWQGPRQLPLSEFFDVEGSAGTTAEETTIVIAGDVPRVKLIGAGMTAGNVIVEGSAGMHVGSDMKGGSILVNKDAGSWAGMEMKGGVLRILGNAQDHVGCAYRGSWHGMTGGRIVIEGNAGSQLGGGMCGGEIIVNGDVENFCAIRQSGGLIVVRGDAVRAAGAEMTGGTLVVCGHIMQFLPGFEHQGTEHDLTMGDVECAGEFMKFVGDYAISKRPKGVLYVSREANESL